MNTITVEPITQELAMHTGLVAVGVTDIYSRLMHLNPRGNGGYEEFCEIDLNSGTDGVLSIWVVLTPYGYRVARDNGYLHKGAFVVPICDPDSIEQSIDYLKVCLGQLKSDV